MNLHSLKKNTQSINLNELNLELEKLKAHKMRFEPEIKTHCDAYINECNAKKDTETLRDKARDNLNNYRTNVIKSYQKTVNDYLHSFGASFKLEKLKHTDLNTGSTTVYTLVINDKNIKINAESGPSFRNTLSAGDRNTLALAYFFASLELDPNLQENIVVFDDPMSSLDVHRSFNTCQAILKISEKVMQVLVLSHSIHFLCDLWDLNNKLQIHTKSDDKSTIYIQKRKKSSELANWNIESEYYSEHYERHKLVREYIHAPNRESMRIVAEALRPMLEYYLKTLYPEYIKPKGTIHNFIKVCRDSIIAGNKIIDQDKVDELDKLRIYSNQFHHDTGPGWNSRITNESELVNFAERVLQFVR